MIDPFHPPNLRRNNNGQLQPKSSRLEAHVGTHLELLLWLSNRQASTWLALLGCCGQWRFDWSFPTRNHPSLLPNHFDTERVGKGAAGKDGVLMNDLGITQMIGKWPCLPATKRSWRNRWAAALGPWITKRRDGNRKTPISLAQLRTLINVTTNMHTLKSKLIEPEGPTDPRLLKINYLGKLLTNRSPLP